MNGRSCTFVYKQLTRSLVSRNHFHTCGSLPSTVRVFQQVMTVESNSWTTLLVLRFLSSGNFSVRYCWNGSMLIVSGTCSFILARFHVSYTWGDWPVTVDPSVLSHPALQHMCKPAFWPRVPAYWPAFTYMDICHQLTMVYTISTDMTHRQTDQLLNPACSWHTRCTIH